MQRDDPACHDLKIDGGGKANGLFQTRLRRSLVRVAALRPSCLCENGQQHHGQRAAMAPPGAQPTLRPPLVLPQLFPVGRAQLVSGTFRVGNLGELNRLSGHDG